ncbi:hypothetical protein [Aquifex aeolicus]|uniref:hypothetical protein n=1 Tax=Aquifex aeolicus TaxID=63363 RepID=UPI0002DCC321|nr:hypothetical protein [Aquifex aeolicus]
MKAKDDFEKILFEEAEALEKILELLQKVRQKEIPTEKLCNLLEGVPKIKISPLSVDTKRATIVIQIEGEGRKLVAEKWNRIVRWEEDDTL